jgi:hypothetical protein
LLALKTYGKILLSIVGQTNQFIHVLQTPLGHFRCKLGHLSCMLGPLTRLLSTLQSITILAVCLNLEESMTDI